jgi:hypothetical protein
MGDVKNGRFAAELDGDFVVFLIGMRINNLWAVHKWLPVSLAMPRMLAELRKQPELGLLHASYYKGPRVAMTVQYWRSFEQLHAYAHAPIHARGGGPGGGGGVSRDIHDYRGKV